MLVTAVAHGLERTDSNVMAVYEDADQISGVASSMGLQQQPLPMNSIVRIPMSWPFTIVLQRTRKASRRRVSWWRRVRAKECLAFAVGGFVW